MGLVILLAACSPTPAPVAIDGTSAEAFTRSSKAAREQLGPADRLAFDQALASVGGRRHAAEAEALRRTTFDGMTAADVVRDFRQRQR